MDILPLFCEIDDFCRVFEKHYQPKALPGGRRSRRRATRLSQSEVMTILVLYHASGYKNLKAFYLEEITRHYEAEFPQCPPAGGGASKPNSSGTFLKSAIRLAADASEIRRPVDGN